MLLAGAVTAEAGISTANEKSLSGYRFKTEEEYVRMIRPIARKVGLRFNYLPSVLAAQCILETGYGGYSDPNTASMIRYNNHLGMKTSMLNDTWAGKTVWPGRSYMKKTPEWYGGVLTHITDSFRIYDSVEQCLVDYVMFMSWAKLPGGAYKYRKDVIGNASYKRTIAKVRINGYCTDPAYDRSVIRLIKKWHLTALDNGFGIHVSKVKLSRKNPLSLPVGRSYQLKARVSPANAGFPDVKWTSSDSSVAAVTQSGLVTASGSGSCVITAISRDTPSCRASLNVQVKGTNG